MDGFLELVPERDGETVRLVAPDVGLFTDALPKGSALAPGQSAGTLLRLGRATGLVVPAGVRGVVTSERPERVHEPVGFGQLLYELAPLAAGDEPPEDHAEGGQALDGALVLRSGWAGRFYHRPSPDDPAFVVEGDEVRDGAPIGLIEVMKTFTHVVYRAEDGLPARARVVRFLAGDGEDIGAGDPVLEVAPPG